MSLKAEGWADQIKNVLAYANMDIDVLNEEKVDLDVLHSRLLHINRNKWLLEAYTKTKLRTYLEIYNNEDPKALISTFLTRSQHSLLSKLKLGILPLEIECGRWKDDPIENRTYRLCDSALLGDEYHFTLFCNELKPERTAKFVDLVGNPDIDVHSNQEVILKAMFQRENLKTTGRHIEVMYCRRKELLYNL